MKNIITKNSLQTNEDLTYSFLAHIKKTAMFKSVDTVVNSFIDSDYYDDFDYYSPIQIKQLLISNIMSDFILIENNRVLLTCLGHDFLELIESKKELDLKLTEFYNNLQSNH